MLIDDTIVANHGLDWQGQTDEACYTWAFYLQTAGERMARSANDKVEWQRCGLNRGSTCDRANEDESVAGRR